jgi:hypothetical protein
LLKKVSEAKPVGPSGPDTKTLKMIEEIQLKMQNF